MSFLQRQDVSADRSLTPVCCIKINPCEFRPQRQCESGAWDMWQKAIVIRACCVGWGVVSCHWVMRWHYRPPSHMGRSGAGRSGGERRKKAVWTSRLMLTGISAGSEEGVVVWCICCHGVNSHTRPDERVDCRAQGQKATELPYNLLSRFTDSIK